MYQNQLAKWLQLETALGPSYEVVAMKYSSYTTLEGGCNDLVNLDLFSSLIPYLDYTESYILFCTLC